MTTSEERIQALREETERIYQRIAKLKEETEKITQEARAQSQENDRRLAKLRVTVKEHTKQIKDHTKQIKEQGRHIKEQTKQIKEQTKQIKEQTKQIKEQSRQIGGYGDKFGGFTESLAHPSIRRILKERFGAQYQESYCRRSEEHGEVEIDAWGVARNGAAAAYVIEIKSRFRPEHIGQVWRHVEMFRNFEPEYRAAAVYPLLAVVEIDRRHRREVWDAGIYLIDVADGVFELAQPPAGFEPCGDYRAEGSDGGLQRAVPSHLRLVPNAGRKRQEG